MGILALGADERVAEVLFTDSALERVPERRTNDYGAACVVRRSAECHF